MDHPMLFKKGYPVITLLLTIIAAMAFAIAYVFVYRDATLTAKMPPLLGNNVSVINIIGAFSVVAGFFVSSWLLLLLPIGLAVYGAYIYLSVKGLPDLKA